MQCFQILTVGMESLPVKMVLIRLVDMSHNVVFPDPHCRYGEPTDEDGFNQIGGHESQCSVSRSSL